MIVSVSKSARSSFLSASPSKRFNSGVYGDLVLSDSSFVTAYTYDFSFKSSANANTSLLIIAGSLQKLGSVLR